MPKNLWIAKVCHVHIEDGIARELRPRPPVIVAEGDPLVLVLGAVSGVNRYHGWLAVMAKTAGVLPIDNRAAGKDRHAVLLGQGQGQMFPMHKIAADAVAP